MLKKILLVIVISGSFIAGFVVAWKTHYGDPIITVDFKNNSGKDIQSLTIEHEMNEMLVHYKITKLKTGTEKRIYLSAPGESRYDVTIVFSDGSKLTGGQGYVEAGYNVVEEIEKDKINSKIAFW
jgi:hypothetical protein